jgi:hypothetical protein
MVVMAVDELGFRFVDAAENPSPSSTTVQMVNSSTLLPSE